MLKYFNPIAWIQWIAQLIYCWALSIPWRDAAKAIPALILIIVLVTAGMVAWSEDSGWRNRLLNKQLRAALNADDYSTAELVLRRQLKVRPKDAEIAYRLGLARQEQLELEDAANIMRRLVAVKQHEKAARWLIKHEYIGKNWAELDQEQRDEFGALLAMIHQKSPDDLQFKQLYADYLIASDKLPQVVQLLEDLSEKQPLRGLQAAAISRRLGNFSKADRLAEETLARVSQMSEEDPTNAILALAVAQNQLFMKRHREAFRTLERAIRRAKTPTDAERLKQAMGDAIVDWVMFTEETADDTIEQRLQTLKMLEYALEIAPNNPHVLTVVADQVLATLDDDDQEVADRRKALVAGSAAGIQHFIEGTSALLQEDFDKSVMHLKLASELMPHSGSVLNNLAYAMSIRPGADLEQALKIANMAIDQTPKPSPHFYETRGRILFDMGKHLEAVPDLTRALKVPALAAGAHDKLAQCYQELGQEDLSREHAAAAEALATPQP